MSFKPFPTCPKCGAEDECWYEAVEKEKHDGDVWINCCPDCDTEYQVLMAVESTFESTPIKETIPQSTHEKKRSVSQNNSRKYP